MSVYVVRINVEDAAALDGTTPLDLSTATVTRSQPGTQDEELQLINVTVPAGIAFGLFDPGELINRQQDTHLLSGCTVINTAGAHAAGSVVNIRSPSNGAVFAEKTIIELDEGTGTGVFPELDQIIPVDHKLAFDTTADGAAGPHLIQMRLTALDWSDIVDLFSVLGLGGAVALLDRPVPCSASILTGVTITAGQNWEILSVAGLEAPTVPGSLTTAVEGAIVAASAFSGAGFDVHEMVERANPNDGGALSPFNLCTIVDKANGEPIQTDNGEDVLALLQVESTFVNGSAFDDVSGGNRVKVSFVRVNAARTDLEAVPVADIEGKTIQYNYPKEVFLQNLDLGCFTGFRGLVDLRQTWQQTYEAGNVVVTDAAHGPIDITGTESVTINGLSWTANTNNAVGGSGLAGGAWSQILGDGDGGGGGGAWGVRTGNGGGAGGSGGDWTVILGNGGAGAGGAAGAYVWTAGDAGAGSGEPGGGWEINLGDGDGAGTGGGYLILLGDGGASGTGGSAVWVAGDGGAAGGDGGGFRWTGGDAGAGSGGDGGGFTWCGGVGDAGAQSHGFAEFQTPFHITATEITRITRYRNRGTGAGGGFFYDVFTGSSDPSTGAGVPAPLASEFHRDVGGAGTTGQLWLKTGPLDTDWSLVTTSQNLKRSVTAGILVDASTGNLTIVTLAPAPATIDGINLFINGKHYPPSNSNGDTNWILTGAGSDEIEWTPASVGAGQAADDLAVTDEVQIMYHG